MATREKVRDPSKLKKRRQELAAEIEVLDNEAGKVSAKQVLTSEARFKAEYVRMLRFNSRLIRRMNTQLEKNLSSRDIYALSTLMSQQREVINDLRAIADLSQQVGVIYDQAVNPFISDFTQLLTDVYYQLRKLIMETSKPKETEFALNQLSDLVKQLGFGLQTGHGVLRQSIEGILVGATVDNVKDVRKRKSKV